jgi:endonuclease G
VEDFESGSRATYAPANVQLTSGSWFLNNALFGTLASDQKNGTRSVRIRNLGSIRMNFDYSDGASTITVKHAVFGSDHNSTWELQVSTDGGSTYTRIGSPVTSTSSTLQTVTFTANISGHIRVAIVKTNDDLNRINIDDIRIDPFTGGGGTGTLSDDDNMLMGNPNNASTDTVNHDNFLMVKTYYTLSYNRARGTPNWVSWHLQASDLDTFSRSNDFRADTALPAGWYRVCKTCYQGSGFDRGHNCPSADRTASAEANSATFLMTNMFPQAPKLNQQRWARLESFERSLVQQGNELYIIVGSFGTGGTGSNGTKNAINNGHVAVPSNVWKVILVIPDGTNDLSRVTASTRVIAVIMPNVNNTGTDWKTFRTSVDAIESASGYDLLSNLPFGIQQILEARVDNQ